MAVTFDITVLDEDVSKYMQYKESILYKSNMQLIKLYFGVDFIIWTFSTLLSERHVNESLLDQGRMHEKR